MVIEAADRKGSFTDVDEAAAIVYAVDHGARIINRGPADGSGSAEAIRKARRHAVALSWPSLAGAASYRIAVAQNGGAARVIAAASTRRSASYSLVKGKTYRFTVAALDASGTQLAVSTPWTVSLPRGHR